MSLRGCKYETVLAMIGEGGRKEKEETEEESPSRKARVRSLIVARLRRLKHT
jgi:hypothetical protein